MQRYKWFWLVNGLEIGLQSLYVCLSSLFVSLSLSHAHLHANIHTEISRYSYPCALYYKCSVPFSCNWNNHFPVRRNKPILCSDVHQSWSKPWWIPQIFLFLISHSAGLTIGYGQKRWCLQYCLFFRCFRYVYQHKIQAEVWPMLQLPSWILWPYPMNISDTELVSSIPYNTGGVYD